MDCILIQNGKAHQIWSGISKADLCFKIHEGESDARAIFSPAIFSAIIEVESDAVNEGDEWNGARFTPASAPVNPIIPGDVFLARVKDAEYVAVINAASAALAIGDPTMTRWLELVRVNGHVDTKSETAIIARAALVAAKLLTQERADLIFSPL